jgi:aminopeptidase N
LGLALAAAGKPVNPDALYAARKSLIGIIAAALRPDFEKARKSLVSLGPTATDGVSMGKRSLKNMCLSYLAVGEDDGVLKEAFKQATTSVNMTDQVVALGVLAETGSPLRDRALAVFERKWKKMPTIMDKWLAVQAGAKRKGVLKDVRRLLKHPAFTLKNPNRISALIGVFAGNIVGFHAKDGSGYRFIADMIVTIDPINPHSAAALCKQFARWRDYDPSRQKSMLKELRRLKAHKKLSANCAEIVAKSLK